MSGLQEAFYIIGIIYMGLSLLIILGVLIALSVIRKKVASLERTVHEKIDLVLGFSEKAGEVINGVRKLTKHKTR